MLLYGVKGHSLFMFYTSGWTRRALWMTPTLCIQIDILRCWWYNGGGGLVYNPRMGDGIMGGSRHSLDRARSWPDGHNHYWIQGFGRRCRSQRPLSPTHAHPPRRPRGYIKLPIIFNHFMIFFLAILFWTFYISDFLFVLRRNLCHVMGQEVAWLSRRNIGQGRPRL